MTDKEFKTKSAQPNILPKITANGYLVLDVEPATNRASFFWLAISRFSETGELEYTFNLTDIEAENVSNEKRLAMLKRLNKSWSNLTTTPEQRTRRLVAFLHKAENRNLPLFVYGGAPIDLPVLKDTFSGSKLTQDIYDIQDIYHTTGRVDKFEMSLENVHTQLSAKPKVRQLNIHDPRQDIQFTSDIIFNLTLLEKYGK